VGGDAYDSLLQFKGSRGMNVCGSEVIQRVDFSLRAMDACWREFVDGEK
jgi:hypothetical protein